MSSMPYLWRGIVSRTVNDRRQTVGRFVDSYAGPGFLGLYIVRIAGRYGTVQASDYFVDGVKGSWVSACPAAQFICDKGEKVRPIAQENFDRTHSLLIRDDWQKAAQYDLDHPMVYRPDAKYEIAGGDLEHRMRQYPTPMYHYVIDTRAFEIIQYQVQRVRTASGWLVNRDWVEVARIEPRQHSEADLQAFVSASLPVREER